jgi:hypothetical protein
MVRAFWFDGLGAPPGVGWRVMPKRREPPKPERPHARYPTPEERDERVSIPLEFDQAVKGLLAVDPDASEMAGAEAPEK